MSATIIQFPAAARAPYIPLAVLRAAMGKPAGRVAPVLTIPAIAGITASAKVASVEGRAARLAAHDRCLRQASSTLAVAEMKLGHAIEVDADFSRADANAVAEAAEALDDVGNLALADGRKAHAVAWWDLADQVRARLRPIGFLARLAG